MNANIGKQVNDIITNPGVIAATIAGGTIGLAGGAMTSGQQAEEQGLPLSKQVATTFQSGVRTGAIGTTVGFGGSVALAAAQRILRK